MAVVQREVRKRGFFGKIIKYLFIAFNVLMLVWLIAYWVSLGDLFAGVQSEAEMAGGSIGAALGTGALLFVWVAGAVILGLFTVFTRGPRILITEER